MLRVLFPGKAIRGVIEWPALSKAVFALCAAGILQLYFPSLVSRLVDGTLRKWLAQFSGVVDPAATSGESGTGLLLLLTVGAIVVFHYFDMKGFAVAGERMAARLRTGVFNHLSKLPMSWFSHRSPGELSGLMLSDIAVAHEYLINDMRQLLRFAFLVAGSVVMMFVTSPRLALMLLVLAPPAVLAGLFFGRKIRKISQEGQKEMGRLSTVVEEVVGGAHNVKAFGAEKFERQRFAAASQAYLARAEAGAVPRAVFVSVILFLSMSAVVFFMWYGSMQVEKDRLSPGDFTQFMFYLAFAGSGAGSLAYAITRRDRMAGASDRLDQFLAEPVENSDETATDQPEVNGLVEFDGVSFSYPSRPGVAALENVSFKAVPGETIALAGLSGSGKSTIVNLALRFFDAGSGQVRFDGREVTDIPLSWLRRQIALVPQEVMLYGDTIAANIAYGNPDAGEDAVLLAAKRAHADEFIRELPEGYQTRLIDRGTQLSGGQRQRLALARAMLRDPAVLILDEATSALDSESERLIALALAEFTRNRTTIVIAHRFASLKAADRIVLLKSGRVEAMGSHAELKAGSDYYRRLFASQWDA